MKKTDIIHPIYSGGTGSSEEDAIIIHTKDSVVEAEYEYLDGKYGLDWQLVSQSLERTETGKRIDVMEIRVAKGLVVSVYFDITESMP